MLHGAEKGNFVWYYIACWPVRENRPTLSILFFSFVEHAVSTWRNGHTQIQPFGLYCSFDVEYRSTSVGRCVLHSNNNSSYFYIQSGRCRGRHINSIQKLTTVSCSSYLWACWPDQQGNVIICRPEKLTYKNIICLTSTEQSFCYIKFYYIEMIWGWTKRGNEFPGKGREIGSGQQCSLVEIKMRKFSFCPLTVEWTNHFQCHYKIVRMGFFWRNEGLMLMYSFITTVCWY